MAQEQLKLRLEGNLRIQITEGGKVVRTLEVKNAIQPFARTIICRLLGNQANNYLGSIQGLTGGSSQANPPITIVTYPGVNQVSVTAHFDEASFAGTLDELRLNNAAGSTFSKKTGISVTKSSTEAMDVVWTLTVDLY